MLFNVFSKSICIINEEYNREEYGMRDGGVNTIVTVVKVAVNIQYIEVKEKLWCVPPFCKKRV